MCSIANQFGRVMLLKEQKENVMWMKGALSGFVLIVVVLIHGTVMAEMTIEASKVNNAPVVDGMANDTAWSKATAYDIKDQRLGVNVTMRAIRTDDTVFFLVKFPDTDESRLHKPWVWNKDLEVYQIGPQREDTFTFKWNMSKENVNLSNFSDDDYQADIWYWKANRTDPAGFADDKVHILSSEEAKKSHSLISASGKQRYLVRLGDQGRAAQKKRLLTDFQGDVQDQYASQAPDGSRADILAKGIWKNGSWIVEFARKLGTGHDDDVLFDPASGQKYLFGISIAGLYGEKTDSSKQHPYGQGRISEPLYLVLR